MYRDIYKKLLKLYPASFVERFGDSMEQTFDDLYRDWKAKGSGGVMFVTWLFAETLIAIAREHLSSVTFRSAIKGLTSPASAAIISFVLSLPLGWIAVIFFFDIQILQTPLQHVLTTDGQQINMAGRVVMLSGMILLPMAFSLNLVPVMRTFRSDGKIFVHPVNLMLATLILLLITMTLGGLFAETIRCSVLGSPYCD